MTVLLSGAAVVSGKHFDSNGAPISFSFISVMKSVFLCSCKLTSLIFSLFYYLRNLVAGEKTHLDDDHDFFEWDWGLQMAEAPFRSCCLDKKNKHCLPFSTQDATKSILKQKFQYCRLPDLGTWTKKDQGRGLWACGGRDSWFYLHNSKSVGSSWWLPFLAVTSHPWCLTR